MSFRQNKLPERGWWWRVCDGEGETGETIGSEPTPKPALPHDDRATPTLCTSWEAVPPQLLGGAVLVPLGPPPMAPRPAHNFCLFPPTAKPRIHGNFSHDADEPLRVTAKAGDEVTLDCEAQGSPPPLVTWTKDSHPVPASPDR